MCVSKTKKTDDYKKPHVYLTKIGGNFHFRLIVPFKNTYKVTINSLDYSQTVDQVFNVRIDITQDSSGVLFYDNLVARDIHQIDANQILNFPKIGFSVFENGIDEGTAVFVKNNIDNNKTLSKTDPCMYVTDYGSQSHFLSLIIPTHEDNVTFSVVDCNAKMHISATVADGPKEGYAWELYYRNPPGLGTEGKAKATSHGKTGIILEEDADDKPFL